LIKNATQDFAATFDEGVQFFTGSGVLELAHSADYSASISGFSRTRASRLDLGDIGFVDADEATLSGAASGGTLTAIDESTRPRSPSREIISTPPSSPQATAMVASTSSPNHRIDESTLNSGDPNVAWPT
jgi:hypothetical protein